MWVGRNGTWYHGAGTNCMFQNMPSGALMYSTSGSATMTFETISGAS